MVLNLMRLHFKRFSKMIQNLNTDNNSRTNKNTTLDLNFISEIISIKKNVYKSHVDLRKL